MLVLVEHKSEQVKVDKEDNNDWDGGAIDKDPSAKPIGGLRREKKQDTGQKEVQQIPCAWLAGSPHAAM